jgi:hypothetical protein
MILSSPQSTASGAEDMSHFYAPRKGADKKVRPAFVFWSAFVFAEPIFRTRGDVCLMGMLFIPTVINGLRRGQLYACGAGLYHGLWDQQLINSPHGDFIMEGG